MEVGPGRASGAGGVAPRAGGVEGGKREDAEVLFAPCFVVDELVRPFAAGARVVPVHSPWRRSLSSCGTRTITSSFDVVDAPTAAPLRVFADDNIP